jgi:hypothetical protein
LVAWLALSCNPKADELFLVAPAEYRGATVLLDDRPAGELNVELVPGSWQDKAFRRRFPTAPHRLVAAQIDLSASNIAAGSHELDVRAAGLPTLSTRFVWPMRRYDAVLLVMPSPR